MEKAIALMEKREKMLTGECWKESEKMISYKVFRDLLPIAFYNDEETGFLVCLLEEGAAYLSKLIKFAYKYLDVPYECPFEEKDFELTVFQDDRGDVYTVRVEILNKFDWIEVRRIYIRFTLDEEDAYNKGWSFSMEDENGELICYSIAENGYMDWDGTIDVAEPDLLEEEYECTMFEYFCKHHM